MPVRVNDIVTGNLTATVAAVGTLDVRRFNQLGFCFTGLTSETLTIQASYDNGVTWASASPVGVQPVGLGAVVTTIPFTASVGYNCALPPCTHIRFVKSAGTQTVTLKYTLRQA